MRRSRKHKLLLTSTYILIYSIIHVLSKEDLDVGSEAPPTGTSWSVPTSTVGVSTSKTSHHHTMSTTESTTYRGETESVTEESISDSTTTESYKVPTLRPRRTNCTPPAIEQFPRPLMSQHTRKHGGLVIHFLVAIYTFIGLAIVCDEYFVSSLDRICEELKLSPDVAGATFMAAGSSAPELATVVIGVFFAKDDIGVSGVIGSAVFNIMFVISVCALSAGTVCYLNWWPLCRDCFFYAISILVMLCTIFDEVITWGEALFMLLLYVAYCIALHFNQQLEAWAQTWPVPCKKLPEEQSHLVAYKTLDEDRAKMATYTSETAYGKPEQNNTQTTQPVQNNVDQYEVDIFNQWSPTHSNAPSGFDVPQPQMQVQPEPVMQQMSPPDQAPQQQAQVTVQQGPPGQNLQLVQQQYYKPKDQSNVVKVDHLLKPETGYYAIFSWGVVYPIHYMCIKTIPDCKSERYKNWYPFTFLMSMIWISFYSYIMVWMITIIGSTLGVPDTLMGLTFVAAGVSVPDALSSTAVIKEGYGDMAVSNAVGSNVFDILICLGLPWFIQTAIISPGSHVNVISKGLTYSTLSLLSTVIFLVVATHLNGWKLDKRYGAILMLWYIIFIVFAGMYELNIFGQLNPPECASIY